MLLYKSKQSEADGEEESSTGIQKKDRKRGNFRLIVSSDKGREEPA